MAATATISLQDVDYPVLIKELRRARRITQEQLARELDVTFGTVNGWENGRHEPIAALGRRIVELAETAGVEVLRRNAASAQTQLRLPLATARGRRRSQ